MIHSSLTPRHQPLAKTGPRGSRADEKAARMADERRQLDAAHKVVDARDKGHCRVCGRRCDPRALSLVDRAERHHMIRRRYAGSHVPENIVTLCKPCHGEIHLNGTLSVTGNASLTDARGKFCGLKIERLADSAWRVVGMG